LRLLLFAASAGCVRLHRKPYKVPASPSLPTVSSTTQQGAISNLTCSKKSAEVALNIAPSRSSYDSLCMITDISSEAAFFALN